MLEILQFIFSSFWIWLGFTISTTSILYLLIATLALAVSDKNDDNKNDKSN